MKTKSIILFFIFLIEVLVYVSCKKETSCEGCATKNNKPPIVVAGRDQVITLPIDSVLVDGSSSGDLDGMIRNYLWTKISGPSSFNIVKPTDSLTKVKSLLVGTYQFELKVTDAVGLFSKDTIQVSVNAQPTTFLIACDNSMRPFVNARLIPVGTLSIPMPIRLQK